MLRYRNIKGNVTETGQAVEIEDKFDMLVDANDQILETVVSQTHRKPHWLTSSTVLHSTHMVTLTDLLIPAPQHRARC